MIDTFITSVVNTEVWKQDIQELSQESLFKIYLLLRKLEATIKLKKETVRDKLLNLLDSKGSRTETGNLILRFSSGTATKTRKESYSPNIKKLQSLLASKQIDASNVFSTKTEEVVTTTVNMSVVEQLIEEGQLEKEDVSSCFEVSYSLNVTEARSIKNILDGLE